MCIIFRLLINICYGREIKCVKKIRICWRKKGTNDCLLWKKDKHWIYWKTKCVKKKEFIGGLNWGYNRKKIGKNIFSLCYYSKTTLQRKPTK